MGCDIHLVLERRNDEDTKWVGVRDCSGHTTPLEHMRPDSYPWSNPAVKDRNYRLFAKLAGVRGEGPEPRGLPYDASELTLGEVNRFGSDGHSHSWGSLAELLPVFKEECADPVLVRLRLQGMTISFSHAQIAESLFETAIDADDGLDNYRVVYWFDN